MISSAKISRIGLGRLTINTKNGLKSTISINCSRSERKILAIQAKNSNGMECEFVSLLWNGKKINLC